MTLVAGVAFHVAMEEMLNTRGGGPGRRRVDEVGSAVVESTMLRCMLHVGVALNHRLPPSSTKQGGDALWAEENEEERRRRRRQEEETKAAAMGPVANQNLAFRR